ncbi:hypothetical protein KUW00_05135, partial [Halomonas sp. DP5N14-9]|uniref:hypothetical protein n=1 Tax=Halomonas sp. DP5N14-9 TaxID=2859075 RepID=UPI001C9904B4
MEVFVVLSVVVLVLIFLVRRTKKKAASIDPPKSRLERTQLENYDSVKQAMRSPEWKKRAKKARAKARQSAAEKTPVSSISVSAADRPATQRRSSSRPVLQFCYQDASGQVSTREVSNFRVDGDYIKGYCHTRDATRTFRKDNIVEWISGREGGLNLQAQHYWSAGDPGTDFWRTSAYTSRGVLAFNVSLGL